MGGILTQSVVESIALRQRKRQAGSCEKLHPKVASASLQPDVSGLASLMVGMLEIMTRNRSAASLVGLILLLPSSAGAGLFAVAGPQFSGFVEEGSYAVSDAAKDGSIARTKLRDGFLYFSFRVIGGLKAIEHLKKYGSLEVRVNTYAGWSKLGSYEIGINQENWRRNRKAIIDEFNQNKIFNWRTYMQTEQVNYPAITVKISDANSDFVAPLDEDGAYEDTVNIIP